MLIGILGFFGPLAILAIVAWYGWIVPFMESKERSKVGTCYAYGPACGKCRACEIEAAQELVTPTMRDLPAINTRNIRIGEAL